MTRPPPFDKTATFRLSDQQVSSDLGGEVVILDLKGGVYYGLDGVGARVWELLEQPRTLADVASIVRAEFDVDPETCARDLEELLRALHGHGVVIAVDDAD